MQDQFFERKGEAFIEANKPTLEQVVADIQKLCTGAIQTKDELVVTAAEKLHSLYEALENNDWWQEESVQAALAAGSTHIYGIYQQASRVAQRELFDQNKLLDLQDLYWDKIITKSESGLPWQPPKSELR